MKSLPEVEEVCCRRTATASSSPRKGPDSPDGNLLVRMTSISGAENGACLAYPQSRTPKPMGPSFARIVNRLHVAPETRAPGIRAP
jgi:hypothetical protein